MVRDRNPKLEQIQNKLATGERNEETITGTLTALENKPFKVVREQTQEKKIVESGNDLKTQEEETKNCDDLKVLKKQYQELERDYEALKKRSYEEVEYQKHESEKTVKKLILEHGREIFVLQKQNELMIENARIQVEHLGGDTSIISMDNFRLTEDEMALKFNPCNHRIQKADYKRMLETNNNLVHCVVCRESLRGEVENFYWKEDWPLTYTSDALLQYDVIKANAEPIYALQQMKKQGKFEQVRKLQLFPVAKISNNPQLYQEVINRRSILPRLIYQESEMLTMEEKNKIENELPRFPIDPTGKLTMDSALLNSILQLSPDFNMSNYFKKKELAVSGAPTWRQTKYPGSPYYTMPMPSQSRHEMLRYLFALNDPELNQDILAVLRNPQNQRNFAYQSQGLEIYNIDD
jgi:hypothetical protein